MSGSGRPDHGERTREAWERASEKHVREYDQLLAEARRALLAPPEQRLLAPLLADGPAVLHPQSGHGVDDAALVRAGARSVLGLDYSTVAVDAARRRVEDLGLPIRYEVAALPPFPVADAAFDLVYTGKGALIWLPDLAAWAAEVFRVLRPGGTLFVHESHPAVPLWSWDEDVVRVRSDRDYFARTHVNDSFPGGGAVEHQHTFAETVMAVVGAGLSLQALEEHADPFWRPEGVHAAAWSGSVPNTFSLLARRPEA